MNFQIESDAFYEKCKKINDLMLELANIADENGRIENAKLLRIKAENALHQKFDILVVGEFSVGKSSLLNAIIGKKILPASHLPTTPILTILKYGEIQKATIFYKNGKTEEIEVEKFAQIYRLRNKDLKENKSNRFKNVDFAVVEYPLDILKNNVNFIDSPGLNEDIHRTEITLEGLKKSDAVILMFDATHFYSSTEKEFFNEHFYRSEQNNIFIVLNKWDLIEDQKDREDLTESAKDKFASYLEKFGHDHLHMVSSNQGLLGHKNNDDEVLSQSGIKEFNKSLTTFLIDGKGRAILNGNKILAKDTVLQINNDLDMNLAIGQKNVKELENKLESLEPKFDELHRTSKELQAYIINSIDAEQENVIESYRYKIQNISSEIRRLLEGVYIDEVYDIQSDEDRKTIISKYENEINQFLLEKEAVWYRELEGQVEFSINELILRLKIHSEKFGVVSNEIRKEFGGDEFYAPKIESSDVILNRWVLKSTEAFDAPATINLSTPPKWVGAMISTASIGVGAASSALAAATVLTIFDMQRVENRNPKRAQYSDPEMFFMLAGASVTALLAGGVLFWQKNRSEKNKRKFKEQLIDALTNSFSEKFSTLGPQKENIIRQGVSQSFQRIGDELSKAMTSEIADLKNSLNLIIQKRSKEKFRYQKEYNRTVKLQNKLNNIYNNIEQIVSE